MKVIPEDTMNFLVSLPLARQCAPVGELSRWITVMATGREVLLDDLPLELRSNAANRALRSILGPATTKMGASKAEVANVFRGRITHRSAASI